MLPTSRLSFLPSTMVAVLGSVLGCSHLAPQPVDLTAGESAILQRITRELVTALREYGDWKIERLTANVRVARELQRSPIADSVGDVVLLDTAGAYRQGLFAVAAFQFPGVPLEPPCGPHERGMIVAFVFELRGDEWKLGAFHLPFC